MKLRDYVYLDRGRIDSYVDQLDGAKSAIKTKSNKFSLSLSGPKFEHGEEFSYDFSTYHQKIDFLTKTLMKKRDFSLRRPPKIERWGILDKSFVLESTMATKITFPQISISKLSGIKSFSIWISDPDPSNFKGGQWDFDGSFLYLTELAFDDEKYQSTYSGCSALRTIVNAAIGDSLLARHGPEHFGRDNAEHPVTKLINFGAEKGERRKIETLYRIRYMTDEQVYTMGFKTRRVHDILGYPIFIAVS